MLLRSASTPLLNSLVHVSNPMPPQIHQISTSSSSCCYSPISAHSTEDSSSKLIKRSASESDLRHLTKPTSKFSNSSSTLMEDVEEGIGFGLIRSSSYDGMNWALEEDVETTGGGGGGMFHGGGGKGRSDDSDDGTDVHYRKMIDANPGNGIFLSNYAKFLKEVRKDYMKAEEYCGRAVLTCPYDGNVLAMYAELVWKIHGDLDRAESYFNRAVAAAPEDCYVQASYARFLWDAEEEEEEEEEERDEGVEQSQSSRMNFMTGYSSMGSSITA